MPQPRVVIVTTGLGAGGAEHMLFRLAERAMANGVEMLVVSLRDDGVFGGRLRAIGVPVVCCRLQHLAGFADTAKAWFAVRRFSPDVVQGWMYHGSLAASMLAACLRASPRIFWSMRQSVYSLPAEPFNIRLLVCLLRKLVARTGGVIYNSSISCRQHRAVGLISANDVVIGNGIDLIRYRPDAACRTELRAKLGIEPDAPLVGIVARVHPVKDHAGFIAAGVQLLRNLPQVRFLFVGEGTQETGFLESLRTAGIAERAVCLGRVDATERIYPALDLLVLSSAWGEAWPNVLGEAMACGVPCVATDVGEAAQIVGDCGAIIPPGDPSALARACAEILGAPQTRRTELGLAARGRIERLFDIGGVFKAYLSVWNDTRAG